MGLFGSSKSVKAALKRLGHIEAGSTVQVEFKGEKYKGIFLHWAGGKEKGKARVELEGDTAKYREIPADAISLFPLPKDDPEVKKACDEIRDRPLAPIVVGPRTQNPRELPVAEVKAAAEVVPQGKPVPDLYELLVIRIKDFVARCDQHITKEELEAFVKGL